MALHRFPAPRRGACQRGPFSFTKENGPLLIPQEKGFAIASEQLEELQCLPIALPIARRCRVSTARRFASAPTTRCRSAHLVEVRSNSRLPPVSTMRRAKQCRYFARSLPPSKRHSRLTIVRRGCKTVTIRRDSWRSHVHRTYIAQRVQSFKLQTANVGGRGDLPSRSLGGSRGIFSHVREYPPFPVQRLRRCFPPAPCGRKRRYFPFRGNENGNKL